jgi:hypothetical protein
MSTFPWTEVDGMTKSTEKYCKRTKCRSVDMCFLKLSTICCRLKEPDITRECNNKSKGDTNNNIWLKIKQRYISVSRFMLKNKNYYKKRGSRPLRLKTGLNKQVQAYISFISNLSYDRSAASSKTIPPLNAI